MELIAITIGRNVGTIPMADAEWQSFVTDAAAIVSASLAGPNALTFAPKYGTGEWEGIVEESAIIVGIGDEVTHSRATIINDAERLAAKYGQDAVAAAFGESHLAWAWPSAVAA